MERNGTPESGYITSYYATDNDVDTHIASMIGQKISHYNKDPTRLEDWMRRVDNVR